MTWQPDELGNGYELRFLQLHPDEAGPNRAALVRLKPQGDPEFAFLAIHGWNDYFYQTELAETISGMGGQFYGVDLRKYGRAHLSGQLWGYVTDLSTYDEDIHAALDAIYEDLGPDIPLVLYGHSTGGLTAALWADRHPGSLAGLILNSPWLEIQAATITRYIGQPIMGALSRLSPTAELPSADNGFYQRSLTGWVDDDEVNDPSDPFTAEGGWRPHPEYRTFPSPPVRPGWLRAILQGHEQVAAGLHIDAPILVLTSAHSFSSDEWSPEMRSADIVLDVEQIWKRVPQLGAEVTLVKLEGAIHDVTFSRRSVRENAFAHIRAWYAATKMLREAREKRA